MMLGKCTYHAALMRALAQHHLRRRSLSHDIAADRPVSRKIAKEPAEAPDEHATRRHCGGFIGG
jgi:hypothetical protein